MSTMTIESEIDEAERIIEEAFTQNGLKIERISRKIFSPDDIFGFSEVDLTIETRESIGSAMLVAERVQAMLRGQFDTYFTIKVRRI